MTFPVYPKYHGQAEVTQFQFFFNYRTHLVLGYEIPKVYLTRVEFNNVPPVKIQICDKNK